MKSKRNSMISRLMAIIIVVMIFTLVGCQGQPTTNATTAASTATTAATTTAVTTATTAAKSFRILFVSPMVGHPVWLGAKEGMDAAAKEFGFEGVWQGADDHSVEKTVEAFEQAIAEKPDGIVTCPFAPAAFETAMAKAREANIPVTVVAVDTTKTEDRMAFIGTDSAAAGLAQITALHSVVGDDMKIGVIMSNLDAQNQIIMLDAAKEYIKQFPNAEILDVRADSGDMNTAMEVFSSMIDAYPEMNCLMGLEGGGAPGFAKILTERKLTDKICVIPMDDTEQNLAVVRSGEIYGIMAQDFFKMGYLGAKYAWQAAQGIEVPSLTDSGITLVTKDNIDTYKNK